MTTVPRQLLVAVLLGCLLAAGLGPPAGGKDPRARVIVRVNRDLDVSGYVELDETDVLVIRTRSGKVESFRKARIVKIIPLVEPQPGQRGTVYLRNGQTRQGVIVEDGFDEVIIEVEGIQARLKRELIEQVILEPTFQERYDKFRQALKPNMHEEHLALCRWLFEQRRYALARTELTALLAEHPTPAAQRLLTMVDAQMALDRGAAGRRMDSRRGDGRPLLPVIDRADINGMRVLEIDFDRPPRVAIKPDSIARLIERYGSSSLIPESKEERLALYRAEPIDIVRLMFDLRARDLYPEIDVVSEPHSLNLFRRRVHDAWLIPNCSTSRCHGGPDGGRLYLHRHRYREPEVRYTNLLILERLEVDPQWPLVNYDDPRRSLILQYGLPRETARKPHPKVDGWRPLFSRGRRRMLDQSVEWIEAMKQPRPAYPVEFDPTQRLDTPPEHPAPAGPPEPEEEGPPAPARPAGEPEPRPGDDGGG